MTPETRAALQRLASDALLLAALVETHLMVDTASAEDGLLEQDARHVWLALKRIGKRAEARLAEREVTSKVESEGVS